MSQFYSDPQTGVPLGKTQRVQCAFENLVFGVSCNSHRLSELALFFIDLWAEWSTVNSCTLTLCVNQLVYRHTLVWRVRKCFYTFEVVSHIARLTDATSKRCNRQAQAMTCATNAHSSGGSRTDYSLSLAIRQNSHIELWTCQSPHVAD